MKTNILFLWATPRSTSTAFEWMMRQRGDFVCYHEPFNELYYYGEDRRSERDAGVAAKPGHTYAAVWGEILKRAETEKVFIKDFAYSVQHMMDDAFLEACDHSFLVRDPKRVIPALHHHWPDFTQEEVGFDSLAALFDRLTVRDGAPPPVIESNDLLSDPNGTTEAYCRAVGIPFIEDALSWEAGERKEVSWYGEGTGPWHDNLRESTGIKPQKSKYPPIEENADLMNIYQTCAPHYEALCAQKLSVAKGV